jgi:oligosaccharide reducing-end xylanase
MRNFSFILMLACANLLSVAQATMSLEHVDSETGILLLDFTGLINTPFSGVAGYAISDGVEHSTSNFGSSASLYRIAVRGASSNASSAGIDIHFNDKPVDSKYFDGTTLSAKMII